MGIRENNDQIIYDESVPIGGRMKRIIKKVNNPKTAWDGQRELYLYIHEVYRYLHFRHQGFFGTDSILDRFQRGEYEKSQDLPAMALASAYRDVLNDGVMMQDIVDYQPKTEEGIKIWNRTIMAVKNIDARKLADVMVMSQGEKKKFIRENTLLLEFKPQCSKEECDAIREQTRRALNKNDRKTLIDILQTTPISDTAMGSIELKFISNDDIVDAIEVALVYLATGAYSRPKKNQPADKVEKEHPEEETPTEDGDYMPHIKYEKAYPGLLQFRKIVEAAGYYVKYLGITPLKVGPNKGFIIKTSLYEQNTNEFVRHMTVDPGSLYNGYSAASVEHQIFIDEDVVPLSDKKSIPRLVKGLLVSDA